MSARAVFGADYRFRELLSALESHYPIPPDAPPPPPGEMDAAGEIAALRGLVYLESIGAPLPDRFARPTTRGSYSIPVFPWAFPHRDGSPNPRPALAVTYKGLAMLKTPFDTALYSRLIWELQPKTIFEFGSHQGGSALFLSDQMQVQCRESGRVHSFELYTEIISESARHPLLEFHTADMTDLGSLDRELFARAPHPWLVIDDVHVNIEELVRFLSRHMHSGDYLVVEDSLWFDPSEMATIAKAAEDAGFLVDTYYADAFGYNMTCAANAWLRKT